MPSIPPRPRVPTDHETKHLNPGDYTLTGRDQPVARWWLIQAAARVVPELLQSLKSDVYPESDILRLQKKVWRFVDLSRPLAPAGVRKRRRAQFDAVQASRERLRDSLLAWARRFHIKDKEAWLLDGAIRCLASWRRVRTMYEELDPRAFRTLPTETGFILTADPFTFECRGWDPSWVRESDWKRAASTKFEADLCDYLATMRTLVEEAGYRRMAGPVTDYHFEWLAVHWFCRLSFGKISEAADRGERSLTRAERTVIHKSVRKAQRLAGITSLL